MIEIDITEGNREPLPLAITEFFYNDDEENILKEISTNMRNVMSADLERSGLFKSINKEAFIQVKTTFKYANHLNEDVWKNQKINIIFTMMINAQFV